jgi:integrase
MNLRAVQTVGIRGMNRVSHADVAIWRDYIDNLEALHVEAEAIRLRLAEGVLTPASATGPTIEDVPIEAQHRPSTRRVWDKARRAALTPGEYASPLAKRVYDLRHACVSTWLNGGVPPAQVAEWAGHSVAVLLKVYAKCIDGQDQIAKRRIEDALGETGEA